MGKKKDKYFTHYDRVINLYKDRKYTSFIHEATLYLNIRRKDNNMLLYRAKAYRKVKQFDYAIEDLKTILNDGYDRKAIVELYYIYYYLNMYDEAIKLLPILYEKRPINAYSIAISELVMKIQLKIDVKTKKGDKCDYIKTQIFQYSTILALEHIQSDHGYSKDKSSESQSSSFSNNVNIKYLFDVVRNQVKDSEKANRDDVLEVHYFTVPNIGYYNNELCNYLKVIVIPNTDHVISMYPINDLGFESSYNLEYDYETLFNIEKNKVKNLSQIEKFNRRYRRV